VIHHIIAVLRTGPGGENGRAVDMADAELGEIAGPWRRIRECEAFVELKPVGGADHGGCFKNAARRRTARPSKGCSLPPMKSSTGSSFNRHGVDARAQNAASTKRSGASADGRRPSAASPSRSVCQSRLRSFARSFP